MAAIGERLLVFNGGSLELISTDTNHIYTFQPTVTTTGGNTTFALTIQPTTSSGALVTDITTQINLTADQIKTSKDLEVGGNARVDGSLYVVGDLTIEGEINQETVNELHVADRWIYLNQPDEGTDPVTPLDSGLQIRVEITNTFINDPQLFWKSNDKWYLRFASSAVLHEVAYDPFLRIIKADDGNTLKTSDQDTMDAQISILGDTVNGATNITTRINTASETLYITLNDTLSKMRTIYLDVGTGHMVTLATDETKIPIDITPTNSQPGIRITSDYEAIHVETPLEKPPVCGNLNADMVDGYHASDFMPAAYKFKFYKAETDINSGGTIPDLKFDNLDKTIFAALYVNGRYAVPKPDDHDWSPSDGTFPYDWEVKQDANTGDMCVALEFDIPKGTILVLVIGESY